ncbi:adenylate/guanylate cyclase domain-containing protein [Rapidithrix thailandica]|uniref:Adenylate cyclase n=1 Tax=Rapidithrix thailandica TaxID=413964 RepID=A0AAW9SA87_9BACT
MQTKSFILLLFGVIFANVALGQSLTGQVIDQFGLPVKNVHIHIDGVQSVSDDNGLFKLVNDYTFRKKESKVRVEIEGYKLMNYNYSQEQAFLEIILWSSGYLLRGEVTDRQDSPVTYFPVTITGHSSTFHTTTDQHGKFTVSIPPNTKVTEEHSFYVDDRRIALQDLRFRPDYGFVKITFQRAATNTHDSKVLVSNKQPELLTQVTVKVFNEREEQVPDIAVVYNRNVYLTDYKGQFSLPGKLYQNDQKFIVSGFALEQVERKDSEVLLKVSRKLHGNLLLYGDTLQHLMAEDRKDFEQIAAEMTTIKDLLIEKNERLSEEIQRVKDKLVQEDTITDTRRAYLKEYLWSLEGMAKNNEKAFEKSKNRTNDLISQLKAIILEKDSLNLLANKRLNEMTAKNIALQKEKEAAEREFRNRLMLALSFSGLISLLALVYFRSAKKIKRQKNQLQHANNKLEEATIELSYKLKEIQSKSQEIHQQKEQIEYQNKVLELEKKKSDDLLLNILPKTTAVELKEKGKATPKFYEQATVMFADIRGFTKIAEKLRPEEVIAELNEYFFAFDEIIEKHHLEKIKTIGDAYMCAGGLPDQNPSNPIDAVLAGLEIQQFMKNKEKEKNLPDGLSFEVRIGIHTGPLIAGVVGKKKFVYDIWGDTVNVASRMESSSETGKVNISGETYQYIQDFFQCTYRGKIEAKNKGLVDMFFVEKALKLK